MTAVLDQVKNAAYASVGVNLLVTDAIVGREITTPQFVAEHATVARKQATETLTEFRARTEPRVAELEGRLPGQVAEVVSSNRAKAWDFIGIEAPKAGADKTGKAKASKKSAKADTKS